MADRSHWAYWWIFTVTHIVVVVMVRVYGVKLIAEQRWAQLAYNEILVVVIGAMIILLYFVQRGIDKFHEKLFG